MVAVKSITFPFFSFLSDNYTSVEPPPPLPGLPPPPPLVKLDRRGRGAGLGTAAGGGHTSCVPFELNERFQSTGSRFVSFASVKGASVNPRSA